jgi:SAM-dependent methyltransferase
MCMTRLRGADIVIDVSNGVPYFSPVWRRRPSVCLMLHSHADQWGLRFGPTTARVARWMEGTAVPYVYRHRKFVAISRSTADAIGSIGVDPRRVSIIETGVEAPPGGLATRSTEPLFVSLSRLVPHKRTDLLLEAWQSVHPVIGGRLVVVGDGPLLDTLRQSAIGIPGVTFTGHVRESVKWNLLRESWFLIQASLHEGWGMVILEGAAVGTPTLAIDAPGVRDAIVDGKTGVLVPATSESLSRALADEWIRLAADDGRRRLLGQEARHWAEDHTWDSVVDAWESLLEEEVGSRMRRPIGRRFSLNLGQPPAPVARGEAPLLTAPPALHNRDRTGLRRMATLFGAFRTQFEDPDAFYSLLASDTIELLRRYDSLEDKHILDIGGGPGYLAERFRKEGARSSFVEPIWEEMTEPGRRLGYGMVGDGCQLPVLDASFDISCSSNVIEHVLTPEAFLGEMVRVVRPGGTIFLAFTNWLSPFGGHETSPWHYAGGERAARRYERKFGYPPKNRFGKSLFRLSITDVMRLVREQADAELLDAFPRYYPVWTKPLVRLRGVREVLTWNLVVVLKRSYPADVPRP